MSLDISGWWTVEDAKAHIGICQRTWYRYFSWQLAGLGKNRKCSDKPGHEGDRVVYPPETIKALAEWYRNKNRERRRMNKERKRREDIQAWQERMAWAKDFGYTPGSAGE